MTGHDQNKKQVYTTIYLHSSSEVLFFETPGSLSFMLFLGHERRCPMYLLKRNISPNMGNHQAQDCLLGLLDLNNHQWEGTWTMWTSYNCKNNHAVVVNSTSRVFLFQRVTASEGSRLHSGFTHMLHKTASLSLLLEDHRNNENPDAAHVSTCITS